MTTTFDITDLLDDNLDISDLSELNARFHIGTHRAKIGWEVRKLKDDLVIELKLDLLETISLEGEDSEKEHQKPGTKSSVIFKRDGGMQEGRLRQVLEALAPAAGTTKAAEIIRATEGFEVIVGTSKRVGKVPEGGGEAPVYFELKNIAVA